MSFEKVDKKDVDTIHFILNTLIGRHGRKRAYQIMLGWFLSLATKKDVENIEALFKNSTETK
jgi:hypothetical protein